MKFDLKGSVVGKQQIKIDAPVTAVWATLTGINDWHKWQTGVRNTKFLNDLEPGATFTYKSGIRKFRSTIISCEPFHAIGWCAKTAGASKTLSWILESENKFTNVFIEAWMEGLFVGLLKGTFNNKLQHDLAHLLRELKSACEKKVVEQQETQQA